MRYEDAVETLFQAPHEQFVTERKRLASELKIAGDKEGAARLAKLTRPPISAWVVDQLWWRERGAFEALFDAAERVRRGDLTATVAHREAIARLRAQAIEILGGAQHGASEATLRRVTQTLAALAAAGSWAPDLPGALSADRDPPGFEALGVAGVGNVVPFPVQPRPTHAARAAGDSEGEASAGEPAAERLRHDLDRPRHDVDEVRQRREREIAASRSEAAARAEAAADMRRAAAERARAAAERQRLEAALRTARGDVAQREREVVKLERDLAFARTLVTQALEIVVGLEERIAQLDN